MQWHNGAFGLVVATATITVKSDAAAAADNDNECKTNLILIYCEGTYLIMWVA